LEVPTDGSGTHEANFGVGGSDATLIISSPGAFKYSNTRSRGGLSSGKCVQRSKQTTKTAPRADVGVGGLGTLGARGCRSPAFKRLNANGLWRSAAR
jgi:hypothetical protein